MRVLVVHNRYRSEVPSGENLVVDTEISALRAHGVEVLTHLRSSDEIAAMSMTRKATVPFRPIHSREDTTAVDRLLRDHRPDVMHLHNPNPLISMAVVRTAAQRGVPVVQTVHNHRHTCVKGTYLRDGHSCRDCLGKAVPWPAVVHGCYRDSRLQSVPMVTAQTVHRGTRSLISRFIALNADIEEALCQAGVDPGRIVVKPNTIADPGPPTPPGSGFVFVGRLTEEKGLGLLLEAWDRHSDGALGTLTIVGDGPERPRATEAAARRRDVVVTGLLDGHGVAQALRAASVLVVPSTWTEAFPMVILEAFARGRPVLATDLGGLPSIVTEDVGWTVSPRADSLDAALRSVAADGQGRALKGAGARRHYDRDYHPDVVVRQLVDIYESLAVDR